MSTRTFTSLFFLSLIVFNTIGSYSYLMTLKRHFGEEVVRRMKSGKPEPGGSLIIKIPLTNSTISTTYQQSVTEIVFEENIYRPINQHQVSDTLYLVCIVDQRTTKVENQIKDLSNSFAGEGKHTNSGVKLADLVAKYYHQFTNNILNANVGWSIDYQFGDRLNLYLHPMVDLIFHPPQ